MWNNLIGVKAMENKKRMNAQEKIMILRELLENKVQIRELAEKYQ